MIKDEKKLYVIGDKFKNLNNIEQVALFSDVMEMIQAGTLPSVLELISIEQGVNEAQANNLKESLKKYNLNHIKVTSYFDAAARCANELSHKHQTQNTLISMPEQVGEDKFISKLLVDENCAELSDHVSAKHIQFIILIEAARQMGNAVTQKFYGNDQLIYLANEINPEFKGFVYPFETIMEYEVVEKKIRFGGNGKFLVNIKFKQYGKELCAIKISFTSMARNMMTLLEDSELKTLVSQLNQ